MPSATSTEPLFINNSGTVTGYYVDSARVPHGFIRSASGDITTLDPAGSLATFATSINSGGTVGGYFGDTSTDHGFLRAPDGTFTVFDPPGSLNTLVSSNINASGGLAGEYLSTNGRQSFFRTAAGEYTTLNFGISAYGRDLYPQTDGGNNVGTLVGWFDLSNDVNVEGFVRSSSGPFHIIVVPGAAITFPISINASGTIIGYTQTEPGVPYVGFVRSPSGS